MKREPRRSTGQIIVLLVVVLPVLLGAVMLGADFAVLYYNWSVLQKAADSAALAGAAYLPGNPELATSVANNYAEMNGVGNSKADNIGVTVDGSTTPQWVQVTLTRSVPYSFGRAMGLTSATVQATAKATIVTSCEAAGGSHFLPIGIDCTTNDCYKPGQVITLEQNQVGPGDWGPLSLPGMSGVSDMENVTHYGWTSPDPTDQNQILTVNSGGCSNGGPGCVTMQPGQGAVTKIAAGVNDRIKDSSSMALGDSWQNPNPTDPRVAELPMVDYTGVNGSSQLAPITGFAEVWLQGIDNQNNLQVVFIKAVSPGNIPGGTCQNFGSAKPVLTE
jgi:Flp pilus assembly protein TadG